MPQPLASDPPYAVGGNPIALGSRVEQFRVDTNHGALPARLHQKGQVVGRSRYLVYVRFDLDQRLICLRTNLVRVIKKSDDPR
ncbi:MAG: hypothetical protein ABIZ05_14980 [Pseudonocardiaceae bacterium]